MAFAPGGPADIVARLIAQAMQDKLGQSVVVDNKGGAGGNIAARLIAREAADGYTLFVTTSSMAVNQTLYKDPGFDVARDFSPIALMADSPNVLIAHPSEPATNLKDFLRLNKGKSVSYGSAGIGSTPHLTGDHVLRVLGGLDAIHVPYQGAAPALQATAANHVPIASIALPPAVPLVRAGKVKALAVTSIKRNPALPDVPTVAESGFPDFEDYTWVGLFAPAKLPADIVTRLNGIVSRRCRSRTCASVWPAPDSKCRPEPRPNLAPTLSSEVIKWGRIVKQTGVDTAMSKDTSNGHAPPDTGATDMSGASSPATMQQGRSIVTEDGSAPSVQTNPKRVGYCVTAAVDDATQTPALVGNEADPTTRAGHAWSRRATAPWCASSSSAPKATGCDQIGPQGAREAWGAIGTDKASTNRSGRRQAPLHAPHPVGRLLPGAGRRDHAGAGPGRSADARGRLCGRAWHQPRLGQPVRQALPHSVRADRRAV